MAALAAVSYVEDHTKYDCDHQQGKIASFVPAFMSAITVKEVR
jgi:hypothetical protein